MEQAFTMLDVARTIFARQQTREAKIKLALTHDLLGEFATENGN